MYHLHKFKHRIIKFYYTVQCLQIAFVSWQLWNYICPSLPKHKNKEQNRTNKINGKSFYKRDFLFFLLFCHLLNEFNFNHRKYLFQLKVIWSNFPILLYFLFYVTCYYLCCEYFQCPFMLLHHFLYGILQLLQGSF